jgi:glucose/mannose-6-phosphate isomerase
MSELIDLDDIPGLEELDPAEMLPAVASSAAQVREAMLLASEAGIGKLADEGRPRSVVVLGMGGSGVSGDVLTAVAGLECPVPIHVCKSYDLPAWVGAADVVIAVSYSGGTEETLSAATEAARRGVRMIVVGGARSPIAELAEQNRALYVPLPGGRQPRASLWLLSTPVLMAGDALGLLSATPDDLEATARRLEETANTCGPLVESFLNPAKTLAMGLADRLTVVWGTTPMAGVAAYRFACQVNENSKLPATWGVLPEANHNQVVGFDGPYGKLRGSGPDYDPMFDDAPATPGLHLILLRDRGEEHPQVTRRAQVSAELARDRGVLVTEIDATGDSRLERLASLIGPTDWASAYLGLQAGIDPTPVEAIQELKKRIAR